MTTEEEIEDFIEHFGVKGMRWGVSRANRSLNKASRAKDRAKMDKDIDRARSRIESKSFWTDKGSKSHTEYKSARAKYQQDKVKIGTREARKVLNKAKEKRIKDFQTAQFAKSGKETTLAVLGTIGGAVLMTAATRR